MNKIFRKVAEFFGLKPPEQAAIERMMEMEEQEEQSNDMAAVPNHVEMVQMQPVDQQAVMDEDMQADMAKPGSMMEDPKLSTGGVGMVVQDQTKDGMT